MGKFSFKVVKALFKDLPSLLRPKYARVIPHTARAMSGVNLDQYDLKIQYPQGDKDLYAEPFIKDFSDLLKKFGPFELEAVNSFVFGQFTKDGSRWIGNFYEPMSVWKDSWFGCYIIYDDADGKGRRFMLENPEGDPADLDNISREAMAKLTEADQRCVYYSSHDGEDYSIEDCYNEFYWRETGEFKVSVSEDNKGNKWKTVDGSYETLSALTNKRETDMSLFGSIRAYCGLPSKEAYEWVEPWHPIVMPGRLHSRYIEGPDRNFWACVYYCGTEFQTDQGATINTWEDSKIQQAYDRMFRELVIESV